MSSDRMNAFEDLFHIGLEYLYDAEKQLTKALPKMVQVASSPQLKQAFEAHLQETQQHVQRLEQVCAKVGYKFSGRTNHVLEAMTKEAEGMIKNSDPGALRDAALIVAGNQVEHFEMGSYGSLRSFAELLGYHEVLPILEQSLNEEKKADEKLTQVAQTDVNQKAAQFRGAMASR